MGKIEIKALEILKNFPQIEEQPASLSGNNHFGETCRQHLERCASIMRQLCDGMNIHGEDRDMLIACAYLHDLGIYAITRKGNIIDPDDLYWKYYPESNYCRMDNFMEEHPLISADILDKYDIDRKEEIKRIISIHMGHWYSKTPRPKNLYEYLMVLSDFLSTRKEDIFTYTGEYPNAKT